jgi:hypothetical protein
MVFQSIIVPGNPVASPPDHTHVLAVFCFALAAANDQERQEKARNNPKYRLHHCSVHRFVSFF